MSDIDLSYLASPAALFASLARETPLTCTWTQNDDEDDSYWAAACCDHLFVFNDGGPVENGFRYCPYCGRELSENENSNA